jgi:hypothetical protein
MKMFFLYILSILTLCSSFLNGFLFALRGKPFECSVSPAKLLKLNLLGQNHYCSELADWRVRPNTKVIFKKHSSYCFNTKLVGIETITADFLLWLCEEKTLKKCWQVFLK